MTGIDEASGRTPDRSPTPAESSTTTSDTAYPPQLHAGAVGYGPEYGKGAGTSDKLQGLQQELKGKILRKPELVQHGRELRSGGKKMETQDDATMDLSNTSGQPAAEVQDKQDEGQRVRSATIAPEGTEVDKE
ncbi:hypothetical protein LXA43DRAFT_1003367 [Ganoderma leucocontextum]|nr:hypothetical protein LXA43DRAFT_1003367 [Ganoderma leucocontextum]